MSNKPVITVLGGGNGAFAAAADLTLKGFEVRLLEAPTFQETITPVLDGGGIELENDVVEEFESGFARVHLVTTDPEMAMDATDIVLYIVPGFAERVFTDMIKPYIKPNQLIVFFCGVFGGALEFASNLRSSGLNELPLIAEAEALVYGAIKSSATSVRVTGRKQGLAIAGIPASDTEIVLEKLNPLLPDATIATNVVETGLRNANIVLHPPICILNAGRMHPTNQKFRYYWDGVTGPVGQVVEALDRERIQVGKALDLNLPSTKERLLEWYEDQGASGETLAEIMASNPPYEKAIAPQNLDHRFLTEEIPFGLVPLEEFGHSIDVPTPVTSALITLTNELLRRDFRKEGRNMKRLGIEGIAAKKLKEMLAMNS